MTALIDVVIPVHNHYSLTSGCLQRLSRQSVPHRVIVVDDGSTDDTAARVRAEWPEVSVVSLGANRGFAAACNRGVAEGTGEIVVLLNNDVECPPDFLERLARPLSEADVGSVAALMLQPPGERIDSIGLCADVTLAGFPRHHGELREQARAEFPALAGPAGAAAAYRRSAWEQVAGLDEAIFSYMEDLDLALRLRVAGWRSIAASDAAGVHLGSATHVHRSPEQRRHGGYARGYLLRRYGLLRSRVAVRVLVTETIAVLGDLAISGDLSALRGRIAGWRAAARQARLPRPPADAIEGSIGLRESLRLRRSACTKERAADASGGRPGSRHSMSTYDAPRYWEQLLARDYSESGVGYPGLARSLNRAMYGSMARAVDLALKRAGASGPPGRVLDVGAGTGIWVDFWRLRGATEIAGVDLTATAVARLRERWPEYQFSQADVSDAGAELPHDRDLVSAMSVLLHIVDDDRFRQAFLNLSDALRPGGVLVLIEPVVVHGWWGPPFGGDANSKARSLAEYRTALGAAGLELVALSPATVLFSNVIDTRTRIAFRALCLYWDLLTRGVGTRERAGAFARSLIGPAERIALVLARSGPSAKVVIARRTC